MEYKGHEVKVERIAEGWFEGGYVVKAGEKTSWAFGTEEKATAAIPRVIEFWTKWEGKKAPVSGKNICHECGADFNGRECPICGETDMISIRR